MDNTFDTKKLVPQLLHQISGLSIGDAMALLVERYRDKVTFSTSFSLEDQVIAHHILSAGLPVSVFTLDTGRLFAETYSVWSATNAKYGAKVQAFFPDRPSDPGCTL